MTKLYLALEDALAIVRLQNNAWVANVHLVGKQMQCVALDPLRVGLIYCGTFDEGAWRSIDDGRTWVSIGADFMLPQVTSIAVSPLESSRGQSVVYAGTEPSTLYRSEDCGVHWRELSQLRQLPSAPEWSFPPRPYTSHVRWITPDLTRAGRLFVAIEAGALVRSFDGGETWEDRRSDGPFDTHTLAMHRLAPDRLYSAAGDGFMRAGGGFIESKDGGDSWQRPDEGLEHKYLWSVAVDPADPDMIVVSAAHSPDQAHNRQHAASALYRRSHGGSWQRCQDGLPPEQGMLTSVLAAHDSEPGVFYAASNKGVFRSSDAGEHWEELAIHWPSSFTTSRAQALVVSDN